MTGGDEERQGEPESGAQDDVLIEVSGLAKTFRTGLFVKKRVDAVRSVSFTVRRGEIVGFLGPNGSGKTTTIKMLLGLIAPTGGEVRMFGMPVPSRAARARLGFLPENPYVYPYLTPREFVEMSGSLSGRRGPALRRRCEEVLDRTGVLYAADRQVRQLSKGMLQRSALAAALVAEPELLILDEPMSGLDPVGRKEVRDLIFAEREAGRTIFFATHILSDVESLCDNVIILRSGEVAVSGSIRQLLRGEVLHTDIIFAGASDALVAALEADGTMMHRRADVLVAEVRGRAQVGEVLGRLLADGAQVIEVTPRRETLEDLFMRRALPDAERPDEPRAPQAEADG
ncbi:MAG: ABC transporter ATP-binding protein [Polyangiaceae bacterium]